MYSKSWKYLNNWRFYHFKSIIFKIIKKKSNHIVDHTHLEQIAELPLLELRLLYNRIASLPQYYRKVYEILPNLMTLDDYDRDGLMVNDLF